MFFCAFLWLRLPRRINMVADIWNDLFVFQMAEGVAKVKMKSRIVLTTASLTLIILALAQTVWAQSMNQSIESQKKPRDASEYDQNAMMGMYFAVMGELSSVNGQTEQAKGYAESAVTFLQNPSDDFEFYAKGAAYVV